MNFKNKDNRILGHVGMMPKRKTMNSKSARLSLEFELSLLSNPSQTLTWLVRE